MSDEMMNLRTLAEKAPEASVLREMIRLAAERLMALEMVALTRSGSARPSKPSILP